MRTIFKILCLVAFLMPISTWSQKQINPSNEDYETIFKSLPNPPSIASSSEANSKLGRLSQDGYKAIIPGDISDKKEAKLSYKGTLLWKTNSKSMALRIAESKELALVINITGANGAAGDNKMFYKGKDITKKIRPKDAPAISGFKIKDDCAYLVYADVTNTWSHTLPTYACYNLKKNTISFQVPLDFKKKFNELPVTPIIRDGDDYSVSEANDWILIKAKQYPADSAYTFILAYKGKNMTERVHYPYLPSIYEFRLEPETGYIYIKYGDGQSAKPVKFGRYIIKEDNLKFPDRQY
ncbi:MAG: hypothetical protein NTX66_01350 [Candidatus Falkowbacteria bacterium]|nr:hypothetical protein [Candidatus Falkowbacteria bacterium]